MLSINHDDGDLKKKKTTKKNGCIFIVLRLHEYMNIYIYMCVYVSMAKFTKLITY